MSDSDRLFVRRLLLALLIATLAFLVWHLASLWLLFFGSILVATVLRAVAGPIERHTPVSSRGSLAVSALLIALVVALAVWLAGNAVGGQVDELSRKIPEAWEEVRSYLRKSRLGSHVFRIAGDATDGAGVVSGLSQATVAVIGSITDLLLVVFGGIFLAIKPRFYLDGILALVPAGSRDRTADTLETCGRALRSWLRGQMLSMLVVGVLITVGLWLIGLPSALALGLLAGLGEFVPIVGTVLAAVPALLLALAQDPGLALWTLLVYTIVQQLQGNVIMPLIQQRMVRLPPALTLFALMAFTLLFGPLGLLFAAPMTVVAYVAVKKIYVRHVLGEETEVPGEEG